MKLKIIQDPEVKEVADTLNNIFEFDDWDLVFDDLPECGFVNDLTFQEMLNKVRPTIKKYAKTPMRCRYVEKRMKLGKKKESHIWFVRQLLYEKIEKSLSKEKILGRLSEESFNERGIGELVKRIITDLK